MPPIPTLDDELLFRLIYQVLAVSVYQQEDKAGSQEMVNATQSLKNISNAILSLKAAEVIRIDQESVAVVLDKLRNP
jgi:hypothetical protein